MNTRKRAYKDRILHTDRGRLLVHRANEIALPMIGREGARGGIVGVKKQRINERSYRDLVGSGGLVAP